MAPHEPLTAETLRWVLGSCDAASVVRSQQLHGGLTSAMDLIMVRDHAGHQLRVVLRRWTAPWPNIQSAVEREAQALRAVGGAGIGAPELIATDPTGEDAGVRCLLMSWVPGQVQLAPPDRGSWLDQLADRLVRIHELPPDLATESSGWFDSDAEHDWIDDPGLRREALAAADSIAANEQRVLRHGDYQPYNVLWSSDDHLTGVVDWTESGIGPRGIDVGHCRLNLAVLHSADAADRLLDRYESAAGLTVDRSADLRALLVWQPVWLEFIPLQVNGRAPLDLDGMRGRVVETVRRALLR